MNKNYSRAIVAGVFILLLAGGSFSALQAASTRQMDAPGTPWPEATITSKPWAYWWWMGCAVDQAELARNLELYAQAGLGGVHIIPIYGVKGWEDRYLDFLSPEWVRMFEYTVAEANRLGMGVDLSTGTGWPFGGPQIKPEFAAKKVKLLQTGVRFRLKPQGTGQQVKRAAPGGEGLVMDHFSKEALEIYLRRFDQAFAQTSARPRAFYNDSYEVYGADWTDRLLEEFQTRRGYDLAEHLDALAGRGSADEVGRVRCDFRETVSDLLLENFTRPWSAWAHSRGTITRNEAHGSPANILDLYAAADIPETEIFGPSLFPIPGLGYWKRMREVDGKPDVLMMKFASSAAHVSGKKLVSSESCTWLNEHFTVTLAQVKPELDQLWLGGVNHVFFHGITFSPTTEPWPGWLFYAETNFGPGNTFWRHLPGLNAYISRTQAFLQSGAPDNDLLLYWPVHDLWSGVYDQSLAERLAAAGRELGKGRVKEFGQGVMSAFLRWYDESRSLVQMLAVHNSREWLAQTGFGHAAAFLRQNGHSFDYISDRMLMNAKYQDNRIVAAGGAYSALVIPRCQYMPLETIRKLADLAQAGATIIFADDLPGDVPGLAKLAERQEQMRRLKRDLKNGERVLVGKDLSEMLSASGAIREEIADYGIGFVRRRDEAGCIYFFSNLTARAWSGWTSLGSSAESVLIFDSLSGAQGVASLKKRGEQTLVYLQLEPGQSLILRTLDHGATAGKAWHWYASSGEPVLISGAWKLEFLEGGPGIPDSVTLTELKSWTELGDHANYFSGAARYTIEFNLPDPAQADEWMLELGRVAESALVRVNGKDAGTVFCHPFRIRVGEFLVPGRNRLELEVVNLPANRIISLERARVDWKKFHNINFVNIQGLPFNTAGWHPFPSGLMGPVKLAPQRIVKL